MASPDSSSTADSAEAGASGSSFSFVGMEHSILDFWQKEDVFQRSLKNTQDKKPYIFYDGPPFATGLPHHGHLVASTIKDIVDNSFAIDAR